MEDKLRPCPKGCGNTKLADQSYCAPCMRLARRESYARHRERRIADTQAWKNAHPEIHTRHVAESKARSPEHYAELARQGCSRRRARKRDAFVEDVDALILLEMDDGLCGICGGDVDPFDYEVDHIQPLSKGGEHSYSNTQVAHPACNRKKSNVV